MAGISDLSGPVSEMVPSRNYAVGGAGWEEVASATIVNGDLSGGNYSALAIAAQDTRGYSVVRAIVEGDANPAASSRVLVGIAEYSMSGVILDGFNAARALVDSGTTIATGAKRLAYEVSAGQGLTNNINAVTAAASLYSKAHSWSFPVPLRTGVWVFLVMGVGTITAPGLSVTLWGYRG